MTKTKPRKRLVPKRGKCRCGRSWEYSKGEIYCCGCGRTPRQVQALRAKRKPRKLTDTELLDWLEKRGKVSRWSGGGPWCVDTSSKPYVTGEGHTLRTAIRRAIKAEEKR